MRQASAAAAHLLVYRGVGIASLLFTIWLGAWGVNLVYGRIVIPILKWVRWMALGFLFVCPLCSFIFSDMAFPLGGALGNSLIEWTNGFAGKAGSLFMLITVFAFFAFIVFQWDIKPLLQKARNLIPARPQATAAGTAPDTEDSQTTGSDTFKDFRHDKEQLEALSDTDAEGDALMVTASNNKLKEQYHNSLPDTEEAADEWDSSSLEMTIVERTEPDAPITRTTDTGKPGIHLELPQEEDFVINEPAPEEPAEALYEEEYEEEEEEAPADGMLDFEIKPWKTSRPYR